MKNEMLEHAHIIFEDVYNRGHGRETTIARFVTVLNISEEHATKLFQAILEA